jgi:hypothetical protein
MSHKHALTLKGDGLLRVLSSEVGVSIPVVQGVVSKAQPKIVSFTGIWDTGATGTMVTSKVVGALSLKATGQTDVHTADGTHTCNTYIIDLYLPMMEVAIRGLNVTEGTLVGADVLIGMDVITLGDFSICNSNGKTIMSFGMPPVESIDYVKKYNEAKNVGMNRKDRRASERVQRKGR